MCTQYKMVNQLVLEKCWKLVLRIFYIVTFFSEKDISITLNQQNNTFEEEIHQIKCD